jgi:competence protein ComEA
LTLVQATPSSPAESIAELSSRQSTWDSTSKASPVHKSRTKAKTQKSSGPVHVNRASAKELEGIKGVGPVLAKKILTERERIGKFSGPADLDRVPGIGKKKLDNLLPFLIFD